MQKIFELRSYFKGLNSYLLQAMIWLLAAIMIATTAIVNVLVVPI
jgi:hypothetical protein